MNIYFPTQSAYVPENISAVAKLWILRILVLLNGHRAFIEPHGIANVSLADTLGLFDLLGIEFSDSTPKRALVELREMHKAAESNAQNALPPAILQANVARLAKLIGLSDIDCRIVEFAVILKSEPMLIEAGDCLKSLTTENLYRVLSVVLNHSEHDIRASLSLQGILDKSGLISIDRNVSYPLNGKIDMLSNQFADQMLSPDADPINLLRNVITLSSPPQLTINDYFHIDKSFSILRNYLLQAKKTGRHGVNVFIHGAPGTGKSQLAKLLAQELNYDLLEVSSETNGGNPVDGESRLKAFRAAQCFFAKQQSLILFDEVEDVFNDGNVFGRKSTAQTKKAWINKILEENPVPTIWLSNTIGCLDSAFIRRFDMVFELPIPPKKQRESILKGLCSDLLDGPSIARIASSEFLAPAVVSKVASIVRLIKDQNDHEESSITFERLINNTLEAQGHKPISRNDPNQLPDLYDPEFIQSDCDLALVAEGIGQSKSGRLCLYGPSGTGKSAYGRWLADQLNIPLIVKRASDLSSMWVGESEKNIAHAFKEAEKDGALLLIDEVDSFLQDRRSARNSWEVTLVNEMLTQMESFSGVFIASTNLMDGLDQAALRRFDLKVKFGYLSPIQATRLLAKYCIQLKLDDPQEQHIVKLKQMQLLTTGDFAAVARRNRFHPILTTDALVNALYNECAVKEGSKPSIGFLH